jgi:hypothetical protein
MTFEVLEGNPFVKAPPQDPPHGFHKSATSDLIVPEAVSREQETWTKQEEKLIRRFLKFLGQYNLDARVICRDERCRKDPTVHAVKDAAGRMVFECEHKVRTCKGI